MPRFHQRKPSSKTEDTLQENRGKVSTALDDVCGQSILPPDHPHMRQLLKEESGNRERIPSPSKQSMDASGDGNRMLGQDIRSKSSRSLKALVEKEKAKSAQRKSERQEEKAMKKSKSSTGLSAFLSRPKSSKGGKSEVEKMQADKENKTPPSSADLAPPPIWAQFASRGLPEPLTTRIPLNDRGTIEEERAFYIPQAYLPSKQRNIFEYQQPSLSEKEAPKPRPKSECLPSINSCASFADRISDLQYGYQKGKPGKSSPTKLANSAVNGDRQSRSKDGLSSRNPSSEGSQVSEDSTRSVLAAAKPVSRVMAAVAAHDGKEKELPKEPRKESPHPQLDAKAIESAFESLLEARNVPHNTRDKMRSLETNIKADFVKQEKSSVGSASSSEGLAFQSSRPNTGKPSKTNNAALGHDEEIQEPTDSKSAKKSRPRSLTFTFSKGGQSPSKKQKSERPGSHQRSKSGGLTPSASSTSLASISSAHGSGVFGRTYKPAAPEDFISYLGKVQNPQDVEVGKVHKLRQLLRNETVNWVETFITQGGMTELVELLYRTIVVEWREEHEDTLLHETLLCLKALSTTSSALTHFAKFSPTLFPTLLAMLFDEEKKGPAEYTTRTITIHLLTSYLSSCSTPARAEQVLAYVRDPAPPESAQPPGFITDIYHPRPYRLWSRELSNVCKEVFWIFLHHTNIIPLPPSQLSSRVQPQNPTYTTRHYPRPHPPVPAAPYIGGVEWDATAYLTSHLDLLNSILACLPSQTSRNTLRQELKDSGFEKILSVSLRTCKEKLYGSVHEALATWVGAASEDGWEAGEVRQGPKREECVRRASPRKKGGEAPRLGLDFGLGISGAKGEDEGGWL